ncbi:RNA-directed DNA polymerase, eukaryota, reverse transcriptase zinc-binding domain protein [Tanacetum coccineum]
MITWIMECVSTTSYSVCVNGDLHGYFKGKRGLRQDDHLSPYLFTLIMEVFTLMLQRRARESQAFTYHRYCSDLELINICFADDLFIFAHGDPESATVIMEALDEFKNASGLVPSLPKSTTYFCNVLNYTKHAILQILPFEEGRLPVKYLGVPLVSSRLIYRDCKELIEKVQHRIKDWKNKSLSAAGRLQLVKSLMRNCLWSHGDSQKGKSKVAWEVVCLPMKKGGLGVRRLELFNKSLMRKLLQLRPLIRDHCWVCIGDGATCSIWFDKWCSNSPLASIVTPRDIHRAGLDMSSNVKDVMHNGGWDWPIELSSKYPILNTIATPTVSASLDTLEWHSNAGVTMPFSVATVWNCLRPRATEVPWYNVVWDSMKVMAGLSNVMGSIDIIIDTLIPMSKRRSARSVVAKIVVAACCYYIWQERNFRLFKNLKRSPQQVIDCIKVTVRLKLLSCYFKKSKDAMEVIHLWELPNSILR